MLFILSVIVSWSFFILFSLKIVLCLFLFYSLCNRITVALVLPFPGLTTLVSYNIFNEAMSVAVTMMDTNFSAAFKRSEAYKQLERNVQDEAEELERLRKVGGQLAGW